MTATALKFVSVAAVAVLVLTSQADAFVVPSSRPCYYPQQRNTANPAAAFEGVAVSKEAARIKMAQSYGPPGEYFPGGTGAQPPPGYAPHYGPPPGDPYGYGPEEYFDPPYYGPSPEAPHGHGPDDHFGATTDGDKWKSLVPWKRLEEERPIAAGAPRLQEEQEAIAAFEAQRLFAEDALRFEKGRAAAAASRHIPTLEEKRAAEAQRLQDSNWKSLLPWNAAEAQRLDDPIAEDTFRFEEERAASPARNVPNTGSGTWRKRLEEKQAVAKVEAQRMLQERWAVKSKKQQNEWLPAAEALMLQEEWEAAAYFEAQRLEGARIVGGGTWVERLKEKQAVAKAEAHRLEQERWAMESNKQPAPAAAAAAAEAQRFEDDRNAGKWKSRLPWKADARRLQEEEVGQAQRFEDARMAEEAFWLELENERAAAARKFSTLEEKRSAEAQRLAGGRIAGKWKDLLPWKGDALRLQEEQEAASAAQRLKDARIPEEALRSENGWAAATARNSPNTGGLTWVKRLEEKRAAAKAEARREEQERWAMEAKKQEERKLGATDAQRLQEQELAAAAEARRLETARIAEEALRLEKERAAAETKRLVVEAKRKEEETKNLNTVGDTWVKKLEEKRAAAKAESRRKEQERWATEAEQPAAAAAEAQRLEDARTKRAAAEAERLVLKAKKQEEDKLATAKAQRLKKEEEVAAAAAEVQRLEDVRIAAETRQSEKERLRVDESLAAPPSPPSVDESYLADIFESCDAATPPAKCGAAITNYLEALSTGDTQPSTAGAVGITSYLDSISTSSQRAVGGSTSAAVKSYLDALSTGSVAAPSTKAVTSYLESMSSGLVSPPSSAASISSNLVDPSEGPVPAAVSSQATAASTVPYLDAVSEECNASAPTQKCATAIASYFGALSMGDAQPSMEVGAGIAGYLDAISSAVSPTATGASTGTAVAGYLDALGSGAVVAPSTVAVTSYLDAVSTGEVVTPSNTAAIVSFLSSKMARSPESKKEPTDIGEPELQHLNEKSESAQALTEARVDEVKKITGSTAGGEAGGAADEGGVVDEEGYAEYKAVDVEVITGRPTNDSAGPFERLQQQEQQQERGAGGGGNSSGGRISHDTLSDSNFSEESEYIQQTDKAENAINLNSEGPAGHMHPVVGPVHHREQWDEWKMAG